MSLLTLDTLDTLARRLGESCERPCVIRPGWTPGASEDDGIWHVDIWLLPQDAGVASGLSAYAHQGPWDGFAAYDVEGDTVRCKTFHAPDLFTAFHRVIGPFAKEMNVTKWEGTVGIEPTAHLAAALRGIGMTPLLQADLEASTLVEEWAVRASDPYYDLCREGMKENTYMKFTALSPEDRLNIATDQLRNVERDFFALEIQAATLAPVQTGSDDPTATRRAELEKAAERLQKIVADLTPKA